MRDEEGVLDCSLAGRSRSKSSAEQQLRQQESTLSALMAEEQARWTDCSSRLDELERALGSGRNRE